MHDLTKLESATRTAIDQAGTLDALAEIEVNVLGRKGELTLLLRQLGSMSAEERKSFGQATNATKLAIEAALAARRAALQIADVERAIGGETLDLTEPVTAPSRGHIHPVTQANRDVVELFTRLGFTVVDGPELEGEEFNFDALNMPSWHPARDMQDTFYLEEKGLLLRTQTSPVQIRAMRMYGAPLAILVPGRVYRNEATDATHDYVFDQIEGLVVAKDVSLAHMVTVLKDFLHAYLGPEVPIRIRPGYFPFVEPGLEIDVGRPDPANPGATKWMELLGCGLVHEHVLRAGGVDPSVYRGFAFGFGFTRLVMQRYGITDIRLLRSTDLRYLSQF